MTTPWLRNWFQRPRSRRVNRQHARRILQLGEQLEDRIVFAAPIARNDAFVTTEDAALNVVGTQFTLNYNAGADMLANELADNASETQSINATVPQWSYGTRGTTLGPMLNLFLAANHTNNFGPNGALDGFADTSAVNPANGKLASVYVNTGTAVGIPDGSVATGELAIHPDGNNSGGYANEEKAVVRFTATVAGNYSVNAVWEDIDDCCSGTGAGVDVHVVKNQGVTSSSLFDSAVSREADALPTSVNYAANIFLNIGESLDFVVGTNSQLYGDATRFNATLQLVGYSTGLFAGNGSGPDYDPDNDPIAVASYDAVSAQGATVSVNPNGGFNYNPATSTAAQRLAVGESLVDTFTYSLTDNTTNSIYIAGRDFVANELPNGQETNPNTKADSVWSYGKRSAYNGTAFTPLTAHTDGYVGNPAIQGWLGGESGGPYPFVLGNVTAANVTDATNYGAPGGPLPAGKLVLHPAEGNSPNPFAIVRWTAPASGTYDLTAAWNDISSGGGAAPGVDLHIVVNGVSVFDSVASIETDAFPTSVSTTQVISVLAGQTVDFVLGPNGTTGATYYNDGTVFDATLKLRSQATVSVTVNGQNDLPTVNANGPYSINAGQDLSISAVGTSDIDTTNVLSYRWDFDNDGVTDFITSNQTATIPWQTLQTGVATPLGQGVHTVKLTVFDGTASVSSTAQLTIGSTYVYSPFQDGVTDNYVVRLNPAGTTIEIRNQATNN
ncbi:MAG TPA: VCBS domain-containing protein, partial [Pirellulaceae bacterium]|nr:VCBS domain-containing protein [Pirellulaceae bacterium]